jgi:type IV pilus assembly protein PilY1
VPALTLNPEFPNLIGTMVYVATGQLLGIGDLSTTGVQSVYGIFDPPTTASPPIGFAGIPTRSNLVQQQLANDVTSSPPPAPVRDVLHPLPVTLPPHGTDRGWFVDLNLLPGERVVTDPELEAGGGVVLTTYQPNASVCQGGGAAWLMVFNFATGGSFPLPELDTNGDGKLNSQDAGSLGSNPVGMSLGPVYASQATLMPIGTSLGGVQGTVKQVSVSSTNVRSVFDRGGAKTRISWWELRH